MTGSFSAVRAVATLYLSLLSLQMRVEAKETKLQRLRGRSLFSDNFRETSKLLDELSIASLQMGTTCQKYTPKLQVDDCKKAIDEANETQSLMSKDAWYYLLFNEYHVVSSVKLDIVLQEDSIMKIQLEFSDGSQQTFEQIIGGSIYFQPLITNSINITILDIQSNHTFGFQRIDVKSKDIYSVGDQCIFHKKFGLHCGFKLNKLANVTRCMVTCLHDMMCHAFRQRKNGDCYLIMCKQFRKQCTDTLKSDEVIADEPKEEKRSKGVASIHKMKRRSAGMEFSHTFLLPLLILWSSIRKENFT